MKYPKYPSPCLKCERADKCKTFGYHANCQPWHTWWLWWWNYFRENLGKEPPGKREKFYYEHPDTIRRLMQKNPCDSCIRKEFCVKPCYKYLAWYDSHIQIAKRRLER